MATSPPKCYTITPVPSKVVKLPYIPQTLEKAKLKCLSTISSSVDPSISEFSNCLDIVQKSLSVPDSCMSIYSAVVESVSKDIPHRCKTIKKHCELDLAKYHSDHWSDQLDALTVQLKFKNIVELEPQCRVWNRIISGLPLGQLSFLLRAGADCLPTPMNLR